MQCGNLFTNLLTPSLDCVAFLNYISIYSDLLISSL